MSASYLMGIDLGGGGVRCLLLDTETGQSHCATRSCPPRRTPGTGGLGADLDLAGIWSALGAASREVIQQSGAAPAQIEGVAATSMRFGTVVVDAEGSAILAVPNLDARAAGEGLRMAAEHGDALYPSTGHWPVPIMTAPRLQWLAREHPSGWQRAAHVFSISDWLTWRLSGQALADPSQASVTLLYRLSDDDWHWNWIDELGFPRGIFPEIRASGRPAAPLTSAAASHLGLQDATLVGVGGADTQCALLALAAVNPGQVAAVAGTTAPVQVVVDRPWADADGRLWTARHVVPERWVVESNAGPMGEAVEWVSRLLYPDSPDPVARLFGEAALSQVGATGQLSTLGSQIMNARAMGMPTGDLTLNPMGSFTDPTPRRHLARAIAEGLACGLRANLEQLRDAVDNRFARLALGGGLAQSPGFAAILCDLLDTPIDVSQSRYVSAHGAALCAGVAAGIWSDLSEAAQQAAAPHREWLPKAASAALSQPVYANWTRLRSERADSERLAGELATPHVMAANDRAAAAPAAASHARILVCADFAPASLAALREIGEVEYASYRDKMRLLKGATLVEAAVGFDVLITEIDLVDGASLAALPQLRIVASCRGDAVNVDVPACTAYGIPVINTPGRNADAVADLALAFLLMLARRLPAAIGFLRQPGIEPGDMGQMGKAFTTLQGRELWQKTVGLVGFGAVGRKLSERLSGFGARVLVFDPFVMPEAAAVSGASWRPLAELLAESDFVSLHAAVTDETRELIDADALSRMKPGAGLVNTARAALTDEKALAEALASGQLGGLAVDTFSVEPPGSEHPLLSFENVIATPHIGGNTREVAAHQGQIAVAALHRLLAGECPAELVNPEVLPDFDWQAPRRQPSVDELLRLSGGDGPVVTDLQKKDKSKP